MRKSDVLAVASMGPQLDSCGRKIKIYCTIQSPKLQWGRNLIVAEGRDAAQGHLEVRRASMGPQLDSCGRGRQGEITVRDALLLQWGRNLIVAEGLT